MAVITGYVVLVLGFTVALGYAPRQRRDRRPDGPPCPSEWDISPCTCTGRAGSPNMNCSEIKDGESLRKIFQANSDGKNFRAIEIHDSSLKSLPANVFGKHNFYLFLMSDNQLEQIDKDAFKGSEESAELMRFDNNKLTSFPFDSLATLKKMRVLQLERNQLTEVPANAFPQLTDLEMVDLSDNKITKIGKNAFTKLSALLRLDLANNQLTTEGIDESSFTGLSALENLDISYNKLTILSEKVFGELLKKNVVIHVEKNPLNCEDASMAWVKNLPSSTKEQLKNITC